MSLIAIRRYNTPACNRRNPYAWLSQAGSMNVVYWKHILSFPEVDSEWTVTRKIKVLTIVDGFWGSVFCMKEVFSRMLRKIDKTDSNYCKIMWLAKENHEYFVHFYLLLRYTQMYTNQRWVWWKRKKNVIKSIQIG